MARLRPYSSIIGIFFIKRQEWYLQMHFEWVAVFYNWEIAKNILNLQSETNFFNRILLNQVKSAVFYFLYNSNVHVWYFVFRSCAELGYNNNLLLISCSPQKLTASPQKTSIWWPETSRVDDAFYHATRMVLSERRSSFGGHLVCSLESSWTLLLIIAGFLIKLY